MLIARACEGGSIHLTTRPSVLDAAVLTSVVVIGVAVIALLTFGADAVTTDLRAPRSQRRVLLAYPAEVDLAVRAAIDIDSVSVIADFILRDNTVTTYLIADRAVRVGIRACPAILQFKKWS